MDEFHGGTVPTLQVTDYVCGEVDQVMGKLKRGSGSDLYKLSIMLYVPRKLSIREVARRWKTGRTSIQEKKLQLERIVEICLEERGLVDVEIRVDKVAGQ